MPNAKMAEFEFEFFERLLNTLTTGIFVTDSNHRVRFINQAYADYLELPREAIVGRPITDFIPDSRSPHIAATGLAEMGELRVFKKSGKERVIIVNRLPFPDETGATGMLTHTIFGSRQEFDTVVRRVEYLDKQVASYARRMKSALAPCYTLESILGNSKATQDFKTLLVSYANTDLAVLVTGATGTGKELAANAVHGESQRKEGPFVSINCAAIPKDLFESELFGYAPGAFSGSHKDGKVGLIELADKGTLFLDEIGDTPLAAQAKLLRVLEERVLYRVGSTQPRNVDFRIVAATNRNLKKLIADALFREDLYYRISPLLLRMPTLQERKDDIPMLISHFAERMGKEKIQITPSALEVLSNHCWPGNIRELRNVIARALGLCKGNVLEMSLLPPELLTECRGASSQKTGSQPSLNLQETLENNEFRLILLTLREMNWNVSQSAKKLGISRATMYEKLKKYEITRDNCTCLSGK